MRFVRTEPSFDAPSREEIASRAGIAPGEVIRFDGNTSPSPPSSANAATLAEELARINTYPHGGFPRLVEAIAGYAGVEPGNVVLGAGADDLIMLVARAYAGPGDRIAIANDPTYGLFRIAVAVAGAEVGDDDPALTICCRPNNPTGELGDIPDARPLVVDEAYYEYADVTAADLIGDDVVVIRTFSKAFGLAAARVGYILAGHDAAAELNYRQHPAPISTLAAALALAGLATPPDVRPILEERERFAEELRLLGFEPLPSHCNFLAVPVEDEQALSEWLMLRGLPVRPYRGGIRITVRTREDDDVLLNALRNR